MRLTTVLPLAGLLIAAALVVGCGDGEKTVTGVILDVESSSLTELDSFTFRSNDGELFVFVSDPDAPNNPLEGIFPGHLLGHMQAAEQVTVHYREEGSALLAVRLEHD